MQNDPTPTYSDDTDLQAIHARGYDDGRAAGSWVVDGNTTDETCRTLLELDEEGDPALYDALPTLTLGEYAGDPTFSEILAELDIAPNEDADSERWSAYSDGWHTGAHDQALADARARCPRVTAEIGTSGRTVTLNLTGDPREDLAAAVEAEHDCEDNHCDIRASLDAGYPYIAAGLLSGATECPLVEAVAAHHGYDLDVYRSEDWTDWYAYFKRVTWECSCGSFVFDEDGNEYACDNCGEPRPPVFGLGVLYVDGEAQDEPLDCEQGARISLELDWEQGSPLINSAAIDFNSEAESVTVSISVRSTRSALHDRAPAHGREPRPARPAPVRLDPARDPRRGPSRDVPDRRRVSARRTRQTEGARERAGSPASGSDPLGVLREQAAAAGLDLDALGRALLRERLDAGKARGIAEGRHVHGRVPYGYRTATRGGRLEPVPEQAATVERIFTEAIDGRSPGRIAASLTADGVPTPTGRADVWSPQAVRVIVANRVYVGELHGVKRAHEPLVDRRTFAAAQAALAARARR